MDSFEKILIFDSNYLAYRAFFSMPNLSFEGIPTNVIHGFFAMALRTANTYKSDEVVFCWDSKKSVRRYQYKPYKKRKKDKPDMREAYQQMSLLRESILPTMGFKNVFLQVGLESDDIIAKLCKTYPDNPITIISADRDLIQCLEHNVYLIDPWSKKGFALNEKKALKEFKFPPKRFFKVKAIAGCPSDNVQGVPGVRETTALKYLKGELSTTSKAFKNIVSEEGKAVYKRNLPLVKLPHPRTREFEIKRSDVTHKKVFLELKKYGLKQLMEESTLGEWSCFMRYPFKITSPKKKEKSDGQ